ncbi:MAG TPA: hypothetical protein VGS41_03770 [Chthonomonadales bacterium]|nr:hypothetical protein [Chthonomonadales bacterium]
MRALAHFLLSIGITFVALGISMGGLAGISWTIWTICLAIAAAAPAALFLYRRVRSSIHDRAAHRSVEMGSTLARDLGPQLFGEYPPYVIEAAERLSADKDTTAVPALLKALEGCVDVQRPGWRDVAEALARALGEIGDRRALPVLYRLENVRGIGLIPAIREAIAVIEPQTSLLRAGSEDGDTGLLRPAEGVNSTESKVLLRAPSAN